MKKTDLTDRACAAIIKENYPLLAAEIRRWVIQEEMTPDEVGQLIKKLGDPYVADWAKQTARHIRGHINAN